METYRDLFVKAIDRTEAWGLKGPSFIFAASFGAHDLGGVVVPSRDGIVELSRRLPIEPLERIGSCFQVHLAAISANSA